MKIDEHGPPRIGKHLSARHAQETYDSHHGGVQSTPGRRAAKIECVNTPETDLWRGRSAAARAAERRERVLEAALESLGSAGCGQTTLRDVCRSAGVGLRYFYESFTDLEELFIAAYDRVAEALTRRVTGELATASASAPDRVRAAFAAAIDFVDEDPRRGRILFRETLASDVLRDHGAATVPRFVAMAVAVLTSAGHDGRKTAGPGQMCISAVSGALVALFLDRQAGAPGADRGELAGRPDPGGVKGRYEALVTWRG